MIKLSLDQEPYHVRIDTAGEVSIYVNWFLASEMEFDPSSNPYIKLQSKDVIRQAVWRWDWNWRQPEVRKYINYFLSRMPPDPDRYEVELYYPRTDYQEIPSIWIYDKKTDTIVRLVYHDSYDYHPNIRIAVNNISDMYPVTVEVAVTLDRYLSVTKDGIQDAYHQAVASADIVSYRGGYIENITHDFHELFEAWIEQLVQDLC